MKFWSPQGSNHEHKLQYRLSTIESIGAMDNGQGNGWWINLCQSGAPVADKLFYPTLEARDADYERLKQALEAE